VPGAFGADAPKWLERYTYILTGPSVVVHPVDVPPFTAARKLPGFLINENGCRSGDFRFVRALEAESPSQRAAPVGRLIDPRPRKFPYRVRRAASAKNGIPLRTIRADGKMEDGKELSVMGGFNFNCPFFAPRTAFRPPVPARSLHDLWRAPVFWEILTCLVRFFFFFFFLTGERRTAQTGEGGAPSSTSRPISGSGP